MQWPRLVDESGRPRLLEHGRPPGESAPGPVTAGFAAFIGVGTVVMFGLLVADPSETRLTRMGALAGAILVATGALRVIVTWRWHRGRRTAFEDGS